MALAPLAEFALNPTITGSLLYGLSRAPPQIRERLLRLLERSPVKINIVKLIKVLNWLLAIGLVKKVNDSLSSLALNQWQRKSDKLRWNWPKEIAVVTGGCSGIGAAVTGLLLARGVRVAILDPAPTPPRFQNTDQVLHIKCDITDPDAVNRAADEVRSKLGKPSILLNNAGILHSFPILDTPPEKLRKMFDINLISHWYTCKAFVPDMVKADKGHILTLASIASYITVPLNADYAASKAAVLSFHEALRSSLRNFYKAPNVHCTSIHPSWIRTPLITNLPPHKLKTLGKLLNVDDVAKAIANQIFSCRGGKVNLPNHEPWSMLRAAPHWFQEHARDLAAKLEFD